MYSLERLKTCSYSNTRDVFFHCMVTTQSHYCVSIVTLVQSHRFQWQLHDYGLEENLVLRIFVNN